VPLALGALTLIGLLSLFGRWGYDDPFITFRYADNLRNGLGFVYNVGQRTLSTTAPLYAILLAGLGLIWQDVPAVSNVISIVSIVAAAGLLAGWSQGLRLGGPGMVAALLLTLSPLLLMTTGAETCFYVMLILGAFVAHARSRLLLSAGILALATMVRPDAIVAALALGLYHAIRHKTVPWRPIALYAALVGLWYAGLWLYFGSPIPSTLEAKRQQGQMAISTGFAAGFGALIRSYLAQPVYWLHGILALVGLWSVVTSSREWLPLLAWAILYFVAYSMLGVTRYFWYYAVLVPALVVLVAEGTAAVIRLGARTRLWRPLLVALSGLLVIALLAPLVLGVLGLAWKPDSRHELYTEVGLWLAANTPLEASVASLEVGIIGYYSRRHMIDSAGLIQPEVVSQLSSRSTYLDSTIWAIQNYQPDYVVLQAAMAAILARSGWFADTYQHLRSFSNQESLGLQVYHRTGSQ
jgi:hypothetical protein